MEGGEHMDGVPVGHWDAGDVKQGYEGVVTREERRWNSCMFGIQTPLCTQDRATLASLELLRPRQF